MKNRSYILLLSLYFILLLAGTTMLLLDLLYSDTMAEVYDDKSLRIKYISENTMYKAVQKFKEEGLKSSVLIDEENEKASLDTDNLKSKGQFAILTETFYQGESLKRNMFFRKYLDIFYKDAINIENKDIEGLVNLFMSSDLKKIEEGKNIKLLDASSNSLKYIEEEINPNNPDGKKENPQEDEGLEASKVKSISGDDYILLPNFKIEKTKTINNLNALVIIDKDTKLDGKLEMNGLLIIKSLPKNFNRSNLIFKRGIVIAKLEDYRKIIKPREINYNVLVKFEDRVSIVDIRAFKSKIFSY